ncbi:MAG: FGGY family carbohydrate kinase [Nocardioides sp.]
MTASFLGVDLGTSGLKLTLVAEDGLVVGEAEASYAVQTPQPGFAETDPGVWMDALRDAATRLSGGPGDPFSGTEVQAIGFTGQMHGVVLTGEDGTAVRPALLWPDQRATSVLPEWFGLTDEDRAGLGNPIFAGMAGPMLTWLRRNEPDDLGSAALVRSPKDWLRAQLTGDRVTERSDASATLLWDVTADDWSTAAAGVAGVRDDQLPDVVDSDAVVGKAPWPPGPGGDDQALPTVTVVAGGADTACALSALRASGLATTWSDTVVVNVGTGVQIVRPEVTPTPRETPVTHLYADADGGWYEMLAVQNGGLALTWCQDVLGLDWHSFVDAAATAPAGSEGVAFVPFLTGERGGLAGPASRAGWLGASPSTGRPELARSAFEALAFTIRRGLELLGVGDTAHVVVSGGGAREPWVRQLIADALGRPLSYVSLRSASGVGAAVLAARAVGVGLSVTAEVVQVPASPSSALDYAYERWLRAVQAMAVCTG